MTKIASPWGSLEGVSGASGSPAPLSLLGTLGHLWKHAKSGCAANLLHTLKVTVEMPDWFEQLEPWGGIASLSYHGSSKQLLGETAGPGISRKLPYNSFSTAGIEALLCLISETKELLPSISDVTTLLVLYRTLLMDKSLRGNAAPNCIHEAGGSRQRSWSLAVLSCPHMEMTPHQAILEEQP
eukprot:4588041-Amphidinium_carterae.1